jgi:membrane protein
MKKFKFTDLGYLFKTAFKTWFGRDPFRQSAVIAYNAIFSLPGLLVLVITIAGYIFGKDVVSGHLHQQIAEAMGSDTADQIQQMVNTATRNKNSIWATIISIITIIVGATGVFIELQKTLNIIWEVKATTNKSGVWNFIKTQLFSFGLIISIAFLLLISLVLSSVLAALGNWMRHGSESLLILFQILDFIISLSVITVLFALMFKILPAAKIKWHLVWIGAFLTSVLFVIGKSAIGLYFGKAHPASGYGAAGSIVLILLWTSYSSLIVFFGAEFTKTFSDFYYGEVSPSDIAVKEKDRIK